MYHGKVDLHLHLDGSLSEDVVARLLQREGITMSREELQHNLRVEPECTSLVEYLQKFEVPGQVLQTEYGLELATYELLQRLAGQGLIYTEIRFAPQLHTRKGLTQQEVLKSVLRGAAQAQRDYPTIRAGILLCAMIGGSENRATFDLAKDFYGNGVVGVDLAGAEGSRPLREFAPLFHDMAARNIPFTIHAGECGSWENVKLAVELGARRVGHGCGAIKNEECMDLLRRNHITVEACVISNLQTKAVPNLQSHPIKPFFDRGIAVTVNTDNMTCSNTTLRHEHETIASAFDFSDDDFRAMDANAIRSAFCPDSEKQALLEKL